jgi:hypothetical protein
MRRALGSVRLIAPLAIALVALGGQRPAEASAPTPTAPAGSDLGGAKKKSPAPRGQSNKKKSSSRSKSSRDDKLTHGKSSTLLARQKLAHAQPGKSGKSAKAGKSGTINEDVTLTPFPSHAAAAKKALSQNRRDQLDDAERAARAPEQAERWQTVLFHLRDLDARADSEGCFWRLISYYRLGQIERARSLRPACDLAPKDGGIIEAEDEQAAHLQAAGMLADTGPAPVGNLAPYGGDAPAKIDR